MKKIPKVILLVETSRTFGRELLYGIARYSRSHGPWQFYRQTGGLDESLSNLKDWGADGIIMRTPKKYDDLLEMGLPAVLVIHREEKLGNFPQIVTDGVAVGRMAAEHLLERGFNHFAYCGMAGMVWSKEREEYFNRTINEAGFEVHNYQQPSRRSWNREISVLSEWLVGLPKPLGMMCCNDDRAQHVIEAAKMAGLRVPDDLAIIGVDNDKLVCELSDPPLSSIALSVEPAGYEAAALLDRLMKGERMHPQKIVVHPTHTVTRQSTDILALEDRNLAEALRYIRQNASKSINVNDVAQAATLSRRVLEKRFRKELNRTVYEEIRRVRVNKIISLLLETDLSISDIAQVLQFPGVAHIARYFRRETSMSLQAYRKHYGGGIHTRI